jgi:hypothetical protein
MGLALGSRLMPGTALIVPYDGRKVRVFIKLCAPTVI